jgi:hypothetical protein
MYTGSRLQSIARSGNATAVRARTHPMRKLKTVVKLFTFPAACFACLVWVGVFICIGMKMPHENVGTVTLLVFTGLTFLIPWLALAIAMWRRAGWKDNLMGDTTTKP